MKTVKVSWAFGNFNVSAEVDVTPEQEARMLQLGALQVLQRVPAGRAEKELAGHLWEEGKKGGKVRPKGFERDSIPYTEDNVAKIMGGAFGQTAEIAEGDKVAIRVVKVVEHVKGETSPMVRAQAFVDHLLDHAPEQIRSTFSLLGMKNAKEATRDELVEFAHANGFGADAKKLG